MRRILIVEDEPALAAALEFNLARRGYLAVSVPSVSEAVRVIDEFNPHAILADGGMPDTSGLALANVLRQWEGRRGIKVVAMSGDPDKEQLFRAMPDEYDAYLQKPFSTRDLVAVLERLFDGP